jgi:formate-dependent nitrite reductase membrane component NrfD
MFIFRRTSVAVTDTLAITAVFLMRIPLLLWGAWDSP